MMSNELTPEQVDQAFAELTSGLDQAVQAAPAPPPEPTLPRAWQWGRPIGLVLLTAVTITAAAMAAANYDRFIAAVGGEVTSQTARRAIAQAFVWPSVAALVAGISTLVLFSKLVHYWWDTRGGIQQPVPISHLRAVDVAWGMATRPQRAMIADHQYALHVDGTSESAYTDYMDYLNHALVAAARSGKHRKAAHIDRTRTLMRVAIMHPMSRAEATKYAPHRQPAGAGGGRRAGTGRAAAKAGGILTLGLIGSALLTIAGYFKFMGWAMRGPRR